MLMVASYLSNGLSFSRTFHESAAEVMAVSDLILAHGGQMGGPWLQAMSQRA